ncbi:MAG: hypothetical protein AAF292_13560 [Pseudomonadota bacterium]
MLTRAPDVADCFSLAVTGPLDLAPQFRSALDPPDTLLPEDRPAAGCHPYPTLPYRNVRGRTFAGSSLGGALVGHDLMRRDTDGDPDRWAAHLAPAAAKVVPRPAPMRRDGGSIAL